MGGVDLSLLTQPWKQLGDASVRTLSTHSAPSGSEGQLQVRRMTSLPVASGKTTKTQKLEPSGQVTQKGAPHTQWRLIAVVLSAGQRRSRKQWFWIHYLLRLSSQGAGGGRR